MKKFLLIIALFLVFPMIVIGKTYEINGSEIVISFDQQKWDVFAQGIKQDSYLLEKYGYNDVTMKNYLKDNSMYVYAIYNKEESFEFIVWTDDEIVEYEVDDYDVFGSVVANHMGTEDYQVYENNYKYIKLDYYDPTDNISYINYHIMINSRYYMFAARKENQFSETERSEIEEIIDSVVFREKKDPSRFKIDWVHVIICAFCSILGGTITYFIMRKSEKNKT